MAMTGRRIVVNCMIAMVESGVGISRVMVDVFLERDYKKFRRGIRSFYTSLCINSSIHLPRFEAFYCVEE